MIGVLMPSRKGLALGLCVAVLGMSTVACDTEEGQAPEVSPPAGIPATEPLPEEAPLETAT